MHGIITPPPDLFYTWYSALEARYTDNLTFSEIRRGLQALSTWYVQKRHKLADGVAFTGAGKRAAFGLFYAPLHFLMIWQIVQHMQLLKTPPRCIWDVGCGTGVGACSWAMLCLATMHTAPMIVGIDQNAWALGEARLNLKFFQLSGQLLHANATHALQPKAGDAIILAYTLNEMPAATRKALLQRLQHAAQQGCRILIIEPIARSVVHDWQAIEQVFQNVGIACSTVCYRTSLQDIMPASLALMDKAAGLDHRSMAARVLLV